MRALSQCVNTRQFFTDAFKDTIVLPSQGRSKSKAMRSEACFVIQYKCKASIGSFDGVLKYYGVQHSS
ncbi:hypothetical protein H5410_058505 [Solanum commersonii]|uniref:Uncharacterized protein n=1 Tax=Solanum commersonii TaxID=4109 RepID=A0A9J5WR04_SOLCO|nr:hypothetical protein H5410_058505 [Solanum commersonii]